MLFVISAYIDLTLIIRSSVKVQAFQSLTHALDMTSKKEKLDGLIVSSPTFTHDAIIKEAGQQQVSVFTEKPVDETADKIQDLFEYCDKAGISLCCGFQRRFDPSYVTATAAVHRGEIGHPLMASIFFADHPPPPKQFLLTGGNIYMDLLAHDCDYISHTLQDEVESVYATGTSSEEELAAAGVHDNATVVMNFRKGCVVTIFMSRSASYGYDQRCEIYGNRGLVQIGNVHDNTASIFNEDGVHQSRLQNSFPERFKEAFSRELDTFAGTILDGKPWPVTAEQCIRVQRVADAARISAETGTVVSIDSLKKT